MKISQKTERKFRITGICFVLSSLLLLFSCYRFYIFSSISGLGDDALTDVLKQCATPHSTAIIQRLTTAERTSAQFTHELTVYQEALQSARQQIQTLKQQPDTVAEPLSAEPDTSTTPPDQENKDDELLRVKDDARYYKLREQECGVRFQQLLKEKEAIQTELSFLTDNLVGSLRDSVGALGDVDGRGVSTQFNWLQLIIVVTLCTISCLISFFLGSKGLASQSSNTLLLKHEDEQSGALLTNGPSYSSTLVPRLGGGGGSGGSGRALHNTHKRESKTPNTLGLTVSTTNTDEKHTPIQTRALLGRGRPYSAQPEDVTPKKKGVSWARKHSLVDNNSESEDESPFPDSNPLLAKGATWSSSSRSRRFSVN